MQQISRIQLTRKCNHCNYKPFWVLSLRRQKKKRLSNISLDPDDKLQRPNIEQNARHMRDQLKAICKLQVSTLSLSDQFQSETQICRAGFSSAENLQAFAACSVFFASPPTARDTPSELAAQHTVSTNLHAMSLEHFACYVLSAEAKHHTSSHLISTQCSWSRCSDQWSVLNCTDPRWSHCTGDKTQISLSGPLSSPEHCKNIERKAGLQDRNNLHRGVFQV